MIKRNFMPTKNAWNGLERWHNDSAASPASIRTWVRSAVPIYKPCMLCAREVWTQVNTYDSLSSNYGQNDEILLRHLISNTWGWLLVSIHTCIGEWAAHTDTHTLTHSTTSIMRKSEASFLELVLSFHQMGPRTWTCHPVWEQAL